MTYYNTTNLKGDTLAQERQTAKTQEDLIIKFFQRGRLFRPSQLITMEALHPNTPITSIRRAMSDLTKKGILEKTTRKGFGPYGKREYYWRLKDRQKELF